MCPASPALPDIIVLMLPATFQTSAAVIMLAGGLLACFAGYRVFRVVLAIYGFILGALLASSFMPADQTLWMILTWLGGGLAGAVILVLAYFVGVALLGAGLGAAAAHMISAALGVEPTLVIVIVASVAGALAAMALQRYVIIVATAFGGAQTALIGAAALMGETGVGQAATQAVYRVYPLDPMPDTYWDAWISLALGLAGLVVQLAITGTGKKSRR